MIETIKGIKINGRCFKTDTIIKDIESLPTHLRCILTSERGQREDGAGIRRSLRRMITATVPMP